MQAPRLLMGEGGGRWVQFLRHEPTVSPSLLAESKISFLSPPNPVSLFFIRLQDQDFGGNVNNFMCEDDVQMSL